MVDNTCLEPPHKHPTTVLRFSGCVCFCQWSCCPHLYPFLLTCNQLLTRFPHLYLTSPCLWGRSFPHLSKNIQAVSALLLLLHSGATGRRLNPSIAPKTTKYHRTNLWFVYMSKVIRSLYIVDASMQAPFFPTIYSVQTISNTHPLHYNPFLDQELLD